jgi:undecaprenyl-diphosphatase
MDLITALLMGLVQGLTEWFPVSSTGHLVFAQTLVGISTEEMIFFNLIMHAATLVSVTFFMRRELRKIIPLMFRRSEGLDEESINNRRIGRFALIATIPIVITGLIEGLFLHDLFSSPAPTAVALLFTGAMLWAAEMPRLRKGRSDLRMKDAAMIGIFQSISVIPGISRSGSTTASGCYLGFKREFVATFSFLLSIPAVILAFAYGAVFLEKDWTDWAYVAAAAAVAAVTGVIALRLLFVQIQKFRLRWFAAYCWAVGAAVLVILFV